MPGLPLMSLKLSFRLLLYLLSLLGGYMNVNKLWVKMKQSVTTRLARFF